MSKPNSLRCTAMDTSGTQCGNMVKIRKLVAGQPILCNLHVPGSNMVFQATDDPRQVLQILMKSRDEAIRLRAATAWLDILERERDRPTVIKRLPFDLSLGWEYRLTIEEIKEAKGHRDALAEILNRAHTRTANVRLTMEEENAAVGARVQQSAPMIAPTVPVPTPQPVAPPTEPVTNTRLPESEWSKYGIAWTAWFTNEDGVRTRTPTTNLGDDEAELIINNVGDARERALERRLRLLKDMQRVRTRGEDYE